MVALEALMSESSQHPPGNALLLVLTNTRSMVWILCNVLHWSTPTMGMIHFIQNTNCSLLLPDDGSNTQRGNQDSSI